MRCLKCWKIIDGAAAVYTKSCHHVFCIGCSETAFKNDLSCPLCDTVLTKDGTAKMVVKPDETCVSNAASTMFGFEPKQICETFQKAVQFWTAQKHNEGIKHAQDIATLRNKLDESQAQNANLLKVLEDERLKKKSLQNEKDSLKTLVSELETRYAEKARALRKLSELYNELRQVHRRLEQDLQGVRDMDLPNTIAAGRTAEAAGKFAVDVATNVRSDNAERVDKMEIRTDAYADAFADNRAVCRIREASAVESHKRGEDRRRHGEHEKKRGQRTRREYDPTERLLSSLRDNVQSGSHDLEDNNYLGLQEAHQLGEVHTATDRSPDMFCLAPVDGNDEQASEDNSRRRDRSVRRRDRRRSGEYSEEYRRRDAHPRRASLDRRGR